MSEYIVRMPSDMPYEIKAELNAWYINSEPIVRCRDCEYCYDDDSVWKCAKLDFGIDYITSDVKPNGFCAWGERRES